MTRMWTTLTTTMTGLGNPQLKLITSAADAQEFLRWMGQRRPLNAVAVDLETGEHPGKPKDDALSPFKGKIRLAQVGDAETGWAIPWEEWSGVFYEAMDAHEGLIVGHNFAFDAKWLTVLSRYKVPWDRVHDTMIASQVTNPASGTHGLKPLTRILVDPAAAAAQEVLDKAFIQHGWTWGTVPITYGPYWQYGALDTVITMKLFLEHFWPKIQPGAQFHEAYQIEISTRQIANGMEIRGARIDVEYCEQKYTELNDYAQSVKEWAHANYQGTNIASAAQLGFAFSKLGAEFTEFTPRGAPSANAEQMKKFALDTDPYVKNLAQQRLAYIKADKVAKSYFLNFMDNHIDGVLHPSIKTLEARTGRMSITNPALQTLPSGDATVRRAFLPFREGEGIVSSDLDQVEFRLTANFSKDEALINLFLEADRVGGDVFTSIMQQIYDDPTLTKEDKRRKLVKATVYGKLYGAGVEKMALQSMVTHDAMQAVVSAFDAAYPGIKRFQKEVERLGSELLRREGQAYVELSSGRRLPADDNRLYALTNYTIQGTAAELFKRNLIEIDKAGLGEYMVVPVHDEIVMSIPKEDAAEAMVTIQECMTTREGYRVPLTAGVEGPFDRWGDKY